MAITPSNVVQHELIGLEVEITDAANKSLTGIKGTITDETQNTLTIRSEDKERKVLKEQITLTINLNGETVEVEGKALVGRPQDRMKK